MLAQPHRICLHDLEFRQVPVTLFSSAGIPYTRFERIGVPKIPPSVLNAVFYLYETAEDARAGQNPGGTGFIVGWNKESVGGPSDYYAVTNWHVAVLEGGKDRPPPCPVIRLNTKSNETDVKELRPEDWHFIEGGPDIAVCPIEIEPNIHKSSYIPTDMFASDIDIRRGEVAVGDDVFMAGLFLDHDGEAVNVPSSRFGNISVMPTPFSKIKQETGFETPCYVVDMHSRSGFSGSPVFIYRTPGQDLTTPIEMQFQVQINQNRMYRGQLRPEQVSVTARTIFKFLGIHFGQFEEEWERYNPEKFKSEGGRRGLIEGDAYVKGWSGMTTVMPACFIEHVLENIPELVEMRRAKRAQRAKTGIKFPASETSKKNENSA